MSKNLGVVNVVQVFLVQQNKIENHKLYYKLNGGLSYCAYEYCKVIDSSIYYFKEIIYTNFVKSALPLTSGT